MNSKIVRDALASLDQKSFNSREEAEDALYVLYAKAKLTSVFQGEGHRDLFDRLERARWVENVKGKWVYSLPSLEKFQVAQPEQVTTTNSPDEIAFASELTLTVDDINLLNQVGKANLQLTPALQNLINAGLVFQTFVLSSKGVEALKSTQSLKIKL
jgi:hypothetical protein